MQVCVVLVIGKLGLVCGVAGLVSLRRGWHCEHLLDMWSCDLPELGWTRARQLWLLRWREEQFCYLLWGGLFCDCPDMACVVISPLNPVLQPRSTFRHSTEASSLGVRDTAISLVQGHPKAQGPRISHVSSWLWNAHGLEVPSDLFNSISLGGFTLSFDVILPGICGEILRRTLLC